jgi:hypothetical protein
VRGAERRRETANELLAERKGTLLFELLLAPDRAIRWFDGLLTEDDMYLIEVIEFLKLRDPAKQVPLGFGRPHSYRGYYEQLAFEPVRNTTVGAMLKDAESAIGRTFEGYKGGDYVMDKYTECWLANYGSTGDGIGPMLLRFMLGEIEG